MKEKDTENKGLVIKVGRKEEAILPPGTRITSEIAKAVNDVSQLMGALENLSGAQDPSQVIVGKDLLTSFMGNVEEIRGSNILSPDLQKALKIDERLDKVRIALTPKI
jgi:hypothetical protein